MNASSRRSRLVRLAAGGLLLSFVSPLVAADSPAPVAPPGACAPGSPGGGATESHWQAFWDRYRDPCATIPPGAIPAPAGTAVHTWDGLMARKAAADRFVIYLHEWYMGGEMLGPYGCSHLQRIAAALSGQPVFVVLEPEPSPEVNENRRLQIVHMLQSVGVADAERRVVVAFPTAEGMSALEAAEAYSRGYGGYGGQNRSGINAGLGNPLQPTQGGLTPSFGGFMGGFRGGLSGGYSGF